MGLLMNQSPGAMYPTTAQIVSLRGCKKQVRSVYRCFGQVAKLAKSAQTLPQNALASKDYAKQAH
ncbi:hypothetical protein J2Z48_001491 [Croceifilum oryzae]|uniref:Uncharacterized protein n=1 Tax=Croceifilum oryzae TaxID=1553429 RepID=A0AAJ1TED4_9BACL|nr:hypothetical protein [Croceifilum oryzae]MDQ0417318.1 hypothetical protein [Croceifilum oryzae]